MSSVRSELISRDMGGDLSSPIYAGIGDLWALLKPRVMSLVVFTGLVGLIVAPGTIHPVLGFTAILCIAVGAGASGALNMWFDADIDRKMKRTANRPIPAGRVEAGDALGLGLTLSVASVSVMALAINVAAAALLAFTIFFYAVFYTMWLKRATPQNIVIGGAAGAFPPVIGWAAVTGSISIDSLLLFAIIFIWTPPHFWALSLFCNEDYRVAEVPMLPVVSGVEETKKQILFYSVILAPVGVLPWATGIAGPVYGISALAMGIMFVFRAYKLYTAVGEQGAKSLFKFSILYLFALFAIMGCETLIAGMI